MRVILTIHTKNNDKYTQRDSCEGCENFGEEEACQACRAFIPENIHEAKLIEELTELRTKDNLEKKCFENRLTLIKKGTISLVEAHFPDSTPIKNLLPMIEELFK